MRSAFRSIVLVAATVQSGRQDCVDLSNEDFATMGESAMDRSIGDRAAHESMNRRMVQMMGREGEMRMHVAPSGPSQGT